MSYIPLLIHESKEVWCGNDVAVSYVRGQIATPKGAVGVMICASTPVILASVAYDFITNEARLTQEFKRGHTAAFKPWAYRMGLI